MLAQHIVLPPMASYNHNNASLHPSASRYAAPVPREESRKYQSQTAGFTYAQHELLRQRKTPHGRMVEEYDANTLDENIQLPPSKHVLLSRPIGTQQQTSRPVHSGRSFTERVGSIQVSPQQRGVREQRPSWVLPGSMDSVLHQNGPSASTQYYYHPGSDVPTVLPATLNAQLGPTASAAQQYYGPYWPDGTFSPYRPAPVRDSRFFGRGPGFDQFTAVAHHPTLRRPGRLPASNEFSRHDFGNSFPGLVTHHWLCEQSRDGRVGRLWQEEDLTPGALRYATNGSLHEEPARSYDTVTTNPTSHLNITDASARVAFRDRTFTWAHDVCVELLSKIQHESRLNRQPGGFGHGRSLSKPAIFPKPPQRTGPHFKENPPNMVRMYDWQSKTDHKVSPIMNRPPTALRVSTSKGSLPNTIPFQPPISSHEYMDGRQRSRRPGSDPVHHMNDYYQGSQTFGAAKSALDNMESLCHEADPPWTDGMLLAGCLAYGLGFYGNALSWYQKIVTKDPHHVEAMSNLAATLLALNRRDEALQYWSQAVKLRPGYFEAVEHLIGLLCSTHRAKEAVSILDYVESCLRISTNELANDVDSDNQSRASSSTTVASTERAFFDYDMERRFSTTSASSDQQVIGFGSSGYSIPGSDNGRLLALIHAKGNMLYALGDNASAAASFEDAILMATGHRRSGIQGLIKRILQSCVSEMDQYSTSILHDHCKEPILLSPQRAQDTARNMFQPNGELPGLEFVPAGLAYKAAVSTTSNSLLSLAKIYQDGMSTPGPSLRRSNGTREILALYYLSLSLQQSPSTANNVGILLASVQQTVTIHHTPSSFSDEIVSQTGIAPGSGIGLALQYYNYGLNIDPRHAHLYTNLGSLLKDLGQLNSAIKMYTKAVEFDPKFDIALANLANAVKDQGRIADAITFYRRAVQANPDFAEAVCGLATALNSVCNWYGRGGVYADNGKRDRIHVDDTGMMHEARKGFGWINRVVEIVDKQLKDGETWGTGVLTPDVINQLCGQLSVIKSNVSGDQTRFAQQLMESLRSWSGKCWEGARVVRLVERAVRHISWQWYQDRYIHGKEYPTRKYLRPMLPAALSSPTAPTVLPFHTFTTPLSAKQVRQISQRNALRISLSTLRSPWLPATVYPPPRPPAPCLNVGYVSSDFNNHPLAHLMQSVFGLHDTKRVRAFCYATTSSDGSVHRQQIESEAPVFHDASTWSVNTLVDQVVKDGIHVLVNLNGYTRGARNEVFAARPAPIHMSFMGFAGTLGAEWCDYVYADPISVSQKTLSPWRRNVGIEDRLHPDALVEDKEDWIYAENIIFAKSTFFCVDHKQSAPDAKGGAPWLQDRTLRDEAWHTEQDRRWKLRKELFPNLSDRAIVLGNFNQLYKIDPATFRLYLRILAGVPNAILWLLRFPDVGEHNLMAFAREWAGPDVASRVVFTDVAPKEHHITRASVVDLFLDTPECNAHTTAADVIWSGTPIITWARWEYKMCSRMASSIVASALPEGVVGDEARAELLVNSEAEYEAQAICLANGLRYATDLNSPSRGRGRLLDIRRILWEGRWTSRLFDTARWVRDLETAYWRAWENWEAGEGGDIWM